MGGFEGKKDKKRAGGKWHFVMPTVFVLCLFFLAMFIFQALIIWEDHSIMDTLNVERVTDGWKYNKEAAKRTPVTLPFQMELDKNEFLVFSNILPDTIHYGDYLGIRLLHCDCNIYIDGMFRKGYVQRYDRPFRSGSSSRYILFELTEEDSGKEILIEIKRANPGKAGVKEPVIGDTYSIITHYLRSNKVAFCLAVIFLIIGAFGIVLGSALRVVTKNEIKLDLISWALFLVAIWNLTQSEFRDFLFKDISGIALLPPFALALSPIVLAMYFNHVQRERYRKEYSIFSLVCFGVVGYLTVCQFCHIKDLLDNIAIVFVTQFAGFGVVITMLIRDIKRGLVDEIKIIFPGSLLFCISGVVQMLSYILLPNSSDATPLCLGVFALLVNASILSGIRIVDIERQKNAALISAQMRTSFLANMSHEIRTPINAVLGLNEAIIRESSESNVVGYAQDVDNAGRHLLSLINDILDFSKLDSGKMDLLEQEYKIKELILTCYRMVEKRALEKDINLEICADTNIPSVLFGDQTRIQQIVMNLLTNAIKYTDKGKVVFSLKTEETSQDTVNLIIEVCDTGRGIPKEDLPYLFEAFKRFDEKENRSIEGTGLGLAITHRLLMLMGGKVEVESRYGQGSCFVVTIPQRVVNREPLGMVSTDSSNGVDAKQNHSDMFEAPDAKILIVDDVSMNLRVAESLLKKTLVQIDMASSGDEAIELVRTNHYDVILLDHMMPHKNGIETLHEMNALDDNKCSTTPVIMVSANAIEGAKEMYLSEGFMDYVSKPFSLKDLQTVLLKYLPPELVKKTL